MEIWLWGTGEHRGAQTAARKGVPVGLHRRLAAGTTGDVVEGTRLEDRFRAGFPFVRVEGEVIRAANVDLALRRRPKRRGTIGHHSTHVRSCSTTHVSARIVATLH